MVSSFGDSNKRVWAPAPQISWKRANTKLGRSVNLSLYSGYDHLKYELSCMFDIDLEDRQGFGWKVAFVDNKGDALLMGDDLWEDFVNCVRCIKILSPQEVRQMTVDADLGNTILPNQTCNSSGGGNAWRGGQCDQNFGNPSAG